MGYTVECMSQKAAKSQWEWVTIHTFCSKVDKDNYVQPIPANNTHIPITNDMMMLKDGP